MRRLSLIVAVVVAAGCTTVQNRVDPPGEDWEARLTSQSGTSVTGTAEAESGASGTTATIRIQGASNGGRHPWHIHRGTCGSNGPIVGPATAYPVLAVGSDGRAMATATIALDIGMGDDDAYFVNVHASPQNLGTIIACGQLDD